MYSLRAIDISSSPTELGLAAHRGHLLNGLIFSAPHLKQIDCVIGDIREEVFFSTSALAPFSPYPLAFAIILSAQALRSWVLSFFSTDDVVMLLELDADSC